MTRPVRWTNRSGKITAGGRLLTDGFTAPVIAAIDGQSLSFGLLRSKPGGIIVRPVNIAKCPSECSLYGWVSERTSAQRWLRSASIGKCSQMSMPGVLVLIGLNSPRIACGASGFMSKLSCCANPPERKM